MSNPNPTKKFEIGNEIGKLGGRPAIPQEVKEAKKFNRARYDAIQHQVSQLNYDQLKELSEDPKTDVLTVWIARIYLKSLSTGKGDELERFCDRLMGKPKQEMKVELDSLVDMLRGLQGVDADDTVE